MKPFATLLLAAASMCSHAGAVTPAPIRPGVEVFVEHPPALVRGKRVGLITNQSGVDRQRRSTIDLLRAMPNLTLVALYSPEHGIRGVAETHVAVAAAMNAMNLPGVRFETVEFPTATTARKYPGQVLQGVRFTLTDRAAYRPLATSLLMIDLIRRLHPDQFQWTAANSREPNMLTIERHGGTARLRRAIEEGTLPELLREWERDQATFREKRAPYLIYP